MLSVYKPTMHAKSIFEIDVEFYVKTGIRYLFVDLDNTLDSYKCEYPSERTINYIEKLKIHGIKIFIISNNNKNRVGKYADGLGVKFLHHSGKPFGFKIKKFIKMNEFDANEILMVGDQTTTDVASGNNSGIKTLLTDPIVKEDQLRTRFNRIFDRYYRKTLLKNNELKDWREFYVKN